MKISRMATVTALTAINRKLNHMTIHELDAFSEGPAEFGVHWSALGIVSPEETEEFARELQYASAVARDLNMLKLEISLEPSDMDRACAKKMLEDFNRKNITCSFIVGMLEGMVIDFGAKHKLF